MIKRDSTTNAHISHCHRGNPTSSCAQRNRLGGEIDRLVAEVLASRETACIAPLLCCLDDRFEAQEAMFAIIHAAESFADEHYIPAYLAARPALSRSAPDWAAVLLKRIQNNAHSRAKLESLLSRGSA